MKLAIGEPGSDLRARTDASGVGAGRRRHHMGMHMNMSAGMKK